MRSSTVAVIGTLLLSSCLTSTSLIQTLKTQTKAEAHAQYTNNDYRVLVGWDSSGPIHFDGKWMIGSRVYERVLKLKASSADGGNTLMGKVTFEGSGATGFKGVRYGDSRYTVSIQFYTQRYVESGTILWVQEGDWIIGGRHDQPVVDIDISGNGYSFTGSMTYLGEGPISVSATKITPDFYR